MIRSWLLVKTVRSSKVRIIKWNWHLMVHAFCVVKTVSPGKVWIIKWKLCHWAVAWGLRSVL